MADKSLEEFASKAAPAELRQMAYNSLGYWPPLELTRSQIVDLLCYKLSVNEASVSDVLREWRKEMRAFIVQNDNLLSLPCHKECWRCHDIRVLQCHEEYCSDIKERVEINPEDW